MEKIVWQPPHAVDAKGQEFLASITPRERELQELARDMLKSSHFTEKTRLYEKWSAEQAKAKTSPKMSPPVTK